MPIPAERHLLHRCRLRLDDTRAAMTVALEEEMAALERRRERAGRAAFAASRRLAKAWLRYESVDGSRGFLEAAQRQHAEAYTVLIWLHRKVAVARSHARQTADSC
jgi:hypothetical protein